MNDMKKIYADHAATTKLSSMALEAMMEFLRDDYKNPSTLYSDASISRRAIVNARNRIAECIGAKPSEIIFTSGGTESDNCAIKNIVFNKCNTRRTIITSQIEHHAILNSCKIMEELGYKVVYLPVDNYGVVSIDLLKREINDDTAIVSIMYANNEIGTIQPIREIAQIAHKHGALFHTDAVQAIGHVNINVTELEIDMLSASAHKFNGPKGSGFLYLRDGVIMTPFISGGSQEHGLRAGTENVAGIVGMSVALRENTEQIHRNSHYLFELETTLIKRLQGYNLDFIKNGSEEKIPGNISLSFANAEGEMILHRLDLKGIQIATGSACDSKNTQLSHVVKAIGVPAKYAKGTIRISFGMDNTCEDAIYIADQIAHIFVNRK